MKKAFIIFGLLAIVLAACGPGEYNDFPPAPPAATPTHLPVDPPVAHPTEAPTQTISPVPAEANIYTNAEGGFTMAIPAGWSLTGPLAMNGYHLYILGSDPANSGGPDASQLIIADASTLTVEQFAQQMCSVCPLNPAETATVGGLSATHLFIGGGSAPAVEWYFVVHNGQLLGFSIRPAGEAPVDWVISTLRFDD
jgi:hypothetical protein